MQLLLEAFIDAPVWLEDGRALGFEVVGHAVASEYLSRQITLIRIDELQSGIAADASVVSCWRATR
jgi:hypothetical protein